MNQKTKKLRNFHLFVMAIAIVVLCSATFAAAAPNLVVSAAQPPNPLPESATFASVFTLTNSGDAASTTSTVTIQHPRVSAGNYYTQVFTAGVTCTFYNPTNNSSISVRTCTVPPLAAGASIIVATHAMTGPAVVPAAGVNAAVTATGPTNWVNVFWQWRGVGPADIIAGISTTPSSVLVGQSVTTVVTLQNYGNTAANGFNTHISVPGTVTSKPSYCTSVGGEIDCVSNIVSAGSQSLTIVYNAPATAGVYSATVAADTANIIVETNETNNTAAGNVNVNDTTSLVLSATQPPNPLAPGATFASVFTLTNSGANASAPSIVKIVYPRRLTSDVWTRVVTVSPGITCTFYTPPHTYVNTTATCNVPALAPGAFADVATVAYTGPATVPAAGINAIANGYGPTNSVNVRWEWRAVGLADLAASIGISPSTIIVGRRATASVSLVNTGFAPANGFNTHISVPGTVVSVTGASCTFAGGEVDCTSSIINGGFQSFTIAFDVPTVAGVYAATVSTDTANIIVETNEANNSTTGNNINVTDAFARLNSLSVNPVQVTGLTVFTRTVTISNDGTADALNVSFTDRQTETRFVSATGPAGTSCNAWYVTGQFNRRTYAGTQCSIGTLPAGASVSFDIRLSAPIGSTVPTTLTDIVTPYTTSFRDPLGPTSSQGSFLLVRASGPVAPTNTVLPAITGNANAGSTFSTTSGTWVGTTPFTYSYQWQRCDTSGGACSDISGATASTYGVQSSDAGMTLRSVVTATNAGGSTSISSAVSAVIIDAAPPVNTVAPTLLPGAERQPGFQWGVTTGTWSGTPTISYAYQWQRCDLDGGNCVDIDGETSQFYVLQEADVFSQVQVQVTATNSAGSGTAVSDLSGEIDPVG